MESLTHLIQTSDWVIRALALLAVLCLTVVLEKLYLLIRIHRDLVRLVEGGEAQLPPVRAVLQSAHPAELTMALFESEAMRFLGFLALVAVVAPMLGLIGTFMGVSEVFDGVSSVGLSDPKVIAGGIQKVLVDTIAGLSVAVPAMVFFKGFEAYALRLSLRMEDIMETRRGAAV